MPSKKDFLNSPYKISIEKLRAESKCFERYFDARSSICTRYCPNLQECKDSVTNNQKKINKNLEKEREEYIEENQKGAISEFKRNILNSTTPILEGRISVGAAIRDCIKKITSNKQSYIELFEYIKEEYNIDKPKRIIETAMSKLEDKGYKLTLNSNHIIKCRKEKNSVHKQE